MEPFHRPVSLLSLRTGRPETRGVDFYRHPDGRWRSEILAAAQRAQDGVWYRRRIELDSGANVRVELRDAYGHEIVREAWLDTVPDELFGKTDHDREAGPPPERPGRPGRRIAVISDVHANLPALDAVIAAVGPVDAWWHTGDIVGYGPHPGAVIERLRELGAVGVAGNHDRAVLEPGLLRQFNEHALAGVRYADRILTPDQRAWLARLPLTRTLEGFTLVHGSPTDPVWEYVEGAPAAARSIRALGTRHGLHGHTHVALSWLLNERSGEVVRGSARTEGEYRLEVGRFFLNAGSVGQPRDGDPRASYLVLDLGRGTFRFGRAAYEIELTAADIRRSGLPERLAERLFRGA